MGLSFYSGLFPADGLFEKVKLTSELFIAVVEYLVSESEINPQEMRVSLIIYFKNGEKFRVSKVGIYQDVLDKLKNLNFNETTRVEVTVSQKFGELRSSFTGLFDENTPFDPHDIIITYCNQDEECSQDFYFVVGYEAVCPSCKQKITMDPLEWPLVESEVKMYRCPLCHQERNINEFTLVLPRWSNFYIKFPVIYRFDDVIPPSLKKHIHDKLEKILGFRLEQILSATY